MPTTRSRRQQNEFESSVNSTATTTSRPLQNARGTRSSQRRTGDNDDENNNDYTLSLNETEEDDNGEVIEGDNPVYVLDGVEYTTYVDFVAAKRKRNEDKLRALGFMDESTKFMTKSKRSSSASTTASQRGIKRSKIVPSKDQPTIVRKSSRLSGSKTQLISLDYYVNDWNRDNTTIVRQEGDDINQQEEVETEAAESFFKGRVNNGSDLNLEEAMDLNDPKWYRENALSQAQALMQELVGNNDKSTVKKSPNTKKNMNATSPTSVVIPFEDDDVVSKEISSKIEELSIDKEEWVAKVVPDRIYYVTTHPSESKLLCCAGDKQGYVGLWDVDAVAPPDNANNHGVGLFRPHSRPICCLEWANHESMITASYDGSVRRLNVEKGVFEEIFATYDDSDSTYIEDLGFGLDQGYRYWTQYVTMDPRTAGMSNPSLFVSTSMGDVFHVDLRSPRNKMITFHESVSEKKINSVSLHPNGSTVATAGNDGVVRLFDIRKFGNNRARTKSKSPKVLCQQVAGLSVSSAFFSPSGKNLLTTSFANRLDLTTDAHLKSDGKTLKPTHSIRHNNQTGRWLTTFQANWHPSMDIFCCGSMNKPRCMEIFDSQGKNVRAITGESLSSVMSRTCFHPSAQHLVMVGGNSSGRVVAVR